MSQYGKAAILATQFYRDGKTTSPACAWEMAISQYTDSPNSRAKPCPRGAYLGLCEEGLIRDVPPGKYQQAKSVEKEYAIAAVAALKQKSELADNVSRLWHVVMLMQNEDPNKSHDYQMDVVAALWKNDDIIR